VPRDRDDPRHPALRAGAHARAASPAPRFGGSDAAVAVAAKHVRTYLVRGETPEDMGVKIAAVRERGMVHGRELTCGIRLRVVVRSTEPHPAPHGILTVAPRS
jgi:alkanesulfonate monooxygenase SsuD/methylene tetrahydromethanopterin reductase-like flavin-dependent oxidoreductase (luciferase family)